jgi:peptidyl-prolyl cis-trans isomerase A (cyclophilin A)
MRRLSIVLAALVSVAAAAAGPSGQVPASAAPAQAPAANVAGSAAEAGLVLVVIETAVGEIEVEVDAKHAPVTAANFLAYVDGGLYDGGSFHRTVTPGNQPNDAIRIEVIQADLREARDGERKPAIALERTSVTGLRHRDGAISMARSGADTAESSFFICINDQPSLDFGGQRNKDGQGFAAFGRVTSGMDVVRRIQASPANGQALSPPIAIVKVRRR